MLSHDHRLLSGLFMLVNERFWCVIDWLWLYTYYSLVDWMGGVTGWILNIYWNYYTVRYICWLGTHFYIFSWNKINLLSFYDRLANCWAGDLTWDPCYCYCIAYLLTKIQEVNQNSEQRRKFRNYESYRWDLEKVLPIFLGN